MTKRDLAVLGKLFAREIEGALGNFPGLYQVRNKAPKHLAELQRGGYVDFAQEKVTGGRFPMMVKGWALTERGRMAYCASCKDESA